MEFAGYLAMHIGGRNKHCHGRRLGGREGCASRSKDQEAGWT